MRTIKFRGKKTDDGEWVYGDLFQPIGYYPSILHIEPSEDGKVLYVKTSVSLETIGQFTELHDINEKDIYEGDIVEWNFTYEYICAGGGVEFRDTIVKGIIKWQQGGFILDVIENDFEDAEWYGISELNTDTGSDVEIIGNIHDNPELINGNYKEEKGFDIPHNKHLGNSHDFWKAPQKNSKKIVVQPLQQD